MQHKVKYKYGAIAITAILLIILLTLNISLLIFLKFTFTSLLEIVLSNAIYFFSIFLVMEGFDSIIIEFLSFMANCKCKLATR